MAGNRPDIEETMEVINGENVQVFRLPKFRLPDNFISSISFVERDAHLRPPTSGCPINGLPNELLSYIFTIGYEAQLEEDDGGEDEDEYDSENEDKVEPEFQVLVSHICRRWRNVALETPSLWTHLDFSEGPPFEKSRAYIERSKESPLDIDIDCTMPDTNEIDEDDDDDDDEDLPMPGGGPSPSPSSSGNPAPTDGRVSPSDLPLVRDLIIPHVSRWRVFEFMVNDFKIMHTILTTLATAGPAPELKALLLYHYEDVEEYDVFQPAELRDPALVPFGGSAPALTHVALWGVHVDWPACHFLSGLLELELAYHTKDVRPSYSDFISILQNSPELHTLTLCLSGPAGDPREWPTDLVELPSVENLVLAFHELDYISPLMRRLAFPNVTSLALDFDDEDYSALLDQLGQPVAPGRSGSLLERLKGLKVSGMQCSEAAVDRFYAAMSHLTSLNLNCQHLPECFFDKLLPYLTPEGEKKFVLPDLEMLTTTGVDGEQMRMLVASRRAWVRPIKRVFMEREDDVEEDDEEWLRANVDQFEFFEGSDEETDDELTIAQVDDSDDDEDEDELE